MPLAIPFQTPKHLPRGCQVLRIPQTRASPLRRFNYYENHKPDALTAMKEALISSYMESSWPSTPSWPSSSSSGSGSKSSGTSGNSTGGGGASWGKKGTSSGDSNKGKKTSGAGQNNSNDASKGRKGYSPSSINSSAKVDDKPSGVSRANPKSTPTGTSTEVKVINPNTNTKWPAQKGFRQKQQAENNTKISPKSSSLPASSPPPPPPPHSGITGVQGPYINYKSTANK